jgi:hypothetical protein
MDFQVSRNDFTAPVHQILKDLSADSRELVDMTAERSTLRVTVTGRSIEIPIEAQERGRATISMGVLFKLNRVTGSYLEDAMRIRVSEGKIHIRGASISDPGIRVRPVDSRVVYIPKNANRRDLVALPMIYSLDELEDCGLLGRVLNSQREMGEALDSAFAILSEYGFDRDELGAIGKRKVRARADAIEQALLVRNQRQ